METARNDVVVLSGQGGNDAINGLMRCISELLDESGYTVHFYDMARATPDDMSRLATLLAGGTVAFAASFLGIGHDLEARPQGAPGPVNVWDYTGIPLLKLHGDSPAYFLERHGDVPASGVNAYYFDEHLAFRQWMLPASSSIAAMVDPYFASDTPLSSIDFAKRRHGTLVFVKNGGDPRELMALWPRQLPETISDQLIELALEIEKPGLRAGRFLIHEFVVDYLDSKRIDTHALRPLVRLYVAQLDDYLRRVKSTMIGRALLRFPVTVQGAGWDHVDFSRAKARHAPPLDFGASETVYQNELGIIDMSPNIDGGAHDRMFRAAGAYAFALTNKCSWLEKVCPELNARAFEFDEASIASSVERALAKPAECTALGEAFGKAYRRHYSRTGWVDRLSALADISRIQSANYKPALQPYFVW